jgi:N-sulfoglucosamine sulfohydrolase
MVKRSYCSRRSFLKYTGLGTTAALASGLLACQCKPKAPNILLAISDDQSYPHCSAYGCEFIHTPAFDRVAKEGILFNNAFVSSPGCAPSRASLVLGRYPWQNEHAGNHSAIWPNKFVPFPDILEKNGYFIGFTGKGVGPFQSALGGRDRNPAGDEYNLHRKEPPFDGMDSVDYAENFKAFLNERNGETPFYFMYSCKEPHRRFDIGAGKKSGKSVDAVKVPPFLPDTEEIKSDLLDYAVEIEWFDKHLEKILQTLEENNELDNTIVLVTSDNGMAFPAAKANCYEYGIHVPLAIRWGDRVKKGRVVDDLISLVDVYPTLFDILKHPLPDNFPVAGKSFANILNSNKQGKVDSSRKAVFVSRERHSCSRWQNLGYPQRAIRTDKFLYIWNSRSERWPAGAPEKFDAKENLITAYHDVDQADRHGRIANAILVDDRNNPLIKPYFVNAFNKRPEEELFDITIDPGCMNNLADNLDYIAVKKDLETLLFDYLKETGDPRVVGPDPDIFESYKRYAGMRKYPKPDWAMEMDQGELKALLQMVDTNNEPFVLGEKIGEWGLKMSKWELLKSADKKWQLFDIKNDHQKKKDLAPQMYRQVKDLVNLYEYWQSANNEN